MYLIHNGNRKLGKVINLEIDEGVSITLQSQKKEKDEKEEKEEKEENTLISRLEIPIFGFLSEVSQM